MIANIEDKPWQQRVGNCALLGALVGLLGAVTDGGLLLWNDVPTDPWALIVGSGALVVVAGVGFGLLVALALFVSDWVTARTSDKLPPWLARLLGDALACAPLVWPVAKRIWGGGTMRLSPLATVGPYIGLLVGALGAAVACAVARRVLSETRSSPLWVCLLVALVPFGAAALLLIVERSQHLDAYFYLHLAALQIATLASFFGAELLQVTRWFDARRAAIVVSGLAVLSVVATLAIDWTETNRQRLVLEEQPILGTRLMHALRKARDWDGDKHSAWFGGGDCDDFDDARNPAAFDVPRNGLDENCRDGDAEKRMSMPADCRPVGAANTVPRRKSANLIVVVVDALRWDATVGEAARGLNGIQRLRSEAVDFTRAFSPASSTRRAVPASMAGRADVDPDDDSLLERLSDAGYRTGFFVVDDSVRVFPTFRDRFDDLHPTQTRPRLVSFASGVVDLTGADTTADILSWVDDGRSAEPFAALAIYHDVHQWYRLEGEEFERAAADGDRALYRASVEKADESIVALLDGLEERGLTENTVIALIADHGQGVGDRGLTTHSRHLYPVLTHVPFLLRVPGIEPTKFEETVSLIDVGPTLADLLGVTAIEGAHGRSLLPMLNGTQPYCPQTYFMRDLLQQAVLHDEWLLIRTPSANTVELLDVTDERPPPAAGEAAARDVSRKYPDKVRVLADKLARLAAED